MKRMYQIFGLFILIICSVIFEFKKPVEMNDSRSTNNYVILEGAF